MGGYGSGSYRGKVKATVEDQISLSINEIAFELTPGQEKVRVRLGRTPLELNLTWSDCHFGGKRPWFVCPRCERRVGTVYKKIYDDSISSRTLTWWDICLLTSYGYPVPRPSHPIGCRKCLKLNYRSQQATKGSELERLERMLEQLEKSNAKLLKMMAKSLKKMAKLRIEANRTGKGR